MLDGRVNIDHAVPPPSRRRCAGWSFRRALEGSASSKYSLTKRQDARVPTVGILGRF